MQCLSQCINKNGDDAAKKISFIDRSFGVTL